MAGWYYGIWIAEIGALALGPVLLLRFRWGAGWRWFFLGMGSWALAYVLKAALLGTLQVTAFDRMAPAGVALTAGVISGLTELGLAALFLRRAVLKLPDVLAFGVGIGALEALWVVTEGWLALLFDGAQGPVGAETLLAYPVERALALVIHASTRTLVYVMLRTRQLAAFLIPLAIFTALDGAPWYLELAGGRWEDPRTLAGYYTFAAVISSISAGAAWSFWRRMQRSSS